MEPVFYRAAEVGVHRNSEGAGGEVDASHFDGGLGVEEFRGCGFDMLQNDMDVGGVQADHFRGEDVFESGKRLFDAFFGVAVHRIDVAQADRSAARRDADDRAPLDRLALVRHLEFADQRHGDAKNLDPFDFHRISPR